MKSLAFLLGVVLSFYASCGLGSFNPAGSATTAASEAKPKPEKKGEQCTISKVHACTTSRGGEGCFSRCGVEPSEKYCRMEPLGKCLDGKGGRSCYANHCNAKVFSGPFNPAEGKGLIKIPSSGYGFDVYGDLDMRYGSPRTIARVKELALRVFNKAGYKIYVGNLSNAYGGNSGKHAGHMDGLEVDIAVMGNTPTVKCFNIWESCYLRGASMVLVDEVRKMGGATLIYFNDSHVQDKFPNFVFGAAGHDNHYHIRWYLE